MKSNALLKSDIDPPALAPQLLASDRADHFIHRDGKIFAGTHLIIEVIGGSRLNSVPAIEAALRACVTACKATLLHIHLHHFSPLGVSGVAVLAESHISVHTWPEAGYAAFDVFMCGDAQPWNAVERFLRDHSRRNHPCRRVCCAAKASFRRGADSFSKGPSMVQKRCLAADGPKLKPMPAALQFCKPCRSSRETDEDTPKKATKQGFLNHGCSPACSSSFEGGKFIG
ncbi:UNVERIFIED_CONTAM: hypothetical protein GTU68_010892 [Idotea baltica]|nr:hypothetical protein [Idotea baltica]